MIYLLNHWYRSCCADVSIGAWLPSDPLLSAWCPVVVFLDGLLLLYRMASLMMAGSYTYLGMVVHAPYVIIFNKFYNECYFPSLISVTHVLGLKELSPLPLNLKRLYKETLEIEPILIIISPGADPSQELQELASAERSSECYHQVGRNCSLVLFCLSCSPHTRS